MIEKEKEILLAQISNDPKLAGKPEPVKVKMVEGKIGKFYKENCLVDQAYVKEPDISVSKYVENTAKVVARTSRLSSSCVLRRAKAWRSAPTILRRSCQHDEISVSFGYRPPARKCGRFFDARPARPIFNRFVIAFLHLIC